MTHLKHILFEDPCELAAVVVGVHLLGLFLWRWLAGSAIRRWLWVVPVTAAILFLVQALVVTDRERIESLLERCARAVERGRIADLAAEIDDEFQSNSLDKAELLAMARRLLERYAVENIRIDQLQVHTEDSRARVSFRARCRIVSDVMMIPEHHSRWQLELARRQEGFKIVAIPGYRLGAGRQRSLREWPW